jgi:Tol biopolymer transport system component
VDLSVAACGTGDDVIVGRVLEDNEPNIWRLNTATGELKQLTFGKDIEKGSCTADGRWVVYNEAEPADGVSRILRVSTDGGEPVELARGTAFSPPVSPDGKLFAYGKTIGQGAGATTKIVVQRLDDGRIEQEIGLSPTFDWDRVGWTPDSKAITLVHHTTGGVQNVYMLPLAGGDPAQLTHFDSEPGLIPAYSWSKDGKKFAITRARYNDSDVVMFSGFR